MMWNMAVERNGKMYMILGICLQMSCGDHRIWHKYEPVHRFKAHICRYTNVSRYDGKNQTDRTLI